MYPIYPRRVFWALLAAVGLSVSPVMADDEGGEAVYTAKIGKPLIFGGKKTPTDEASPPSPIAAPVGDVIVMPDHLVDLQQKLRDHPGQRRAEQRVCEAEWSILLGKSNYYPRLNATLSGGSKWTDQTTRADEFGGSN